MLTTALLAYLAAFICYFVQWTFGQPMIDQPLGVGLVAGIIFGDVTAGIIIGAALQAIFIGSVNVGGATSADTVAGTVLAVCFVVVSGMEQGVAIPLAVAAAILRTSSTRSFSTCSCLSGLLLLIGPRTRVTVRSSSSAILAAP